MKFSNRPTITLLYDIFLKYPLQDVALITVIQKLIKQKDGQPVWPICPVFVAANILIEV